MHGTHQQSREEWANSLALIKGCAVGHIVHEDKKQITLAMDLFYSEGEQFRQVASYPKSAIKQIIRKGLEAPAKKIK